MFNSFMGLEMEADSAQYDLVIVTVNPQLLRKHCVNLKLKTPNENSYDLVRKN